MQYNQPLGNTSTSSTPPVAHPSSAIPPSTDLIVARIYTIFAINEFRDRAYDYFRERGERVSAVDDRALEKRLLFELENSAALMENLLDQLGLDRRKDVLKTLLVSFVDDPKHAITRLDPGEQMILERIELRTAGLLISRFGKEVDLADKELAEAAHRRILRNLQDGNIPLLSALEPLAPAPSLETPAILGALASRFLKVHSQRGESEALDLPAYFPFNRLVPNLLFSRGVRAIIEEKLFNQIMGRGEPHEGTALMQKPWAKEAFSGLPELVTKATDRLLASSSALDVDTVRKLSGLLEEHPLYPGIIANVRAGLEPSFLRRVSEGCIEGQTSSAASMRAVAWTIFGADAFLAAPFDTAVRRGFNVLLERKASLEALLDQAFLLPPISRAAMLIEPTVQREVQARVSEWVADNKEFFLLNRDGIDHPTQCGLLDYTEAMLGAAFIEFGWPYREVEIFREFARNEGPLRPFPKATWWEARALSGVHELPMGHYVTEHELLLGANTALQSLIRSYGTSPRRRDVLAAREIDRRIADAPIMPSHHALEGKRLLLGMLLARPEQQQTLLEESIRWHLKYLPPDSEDVRTCIEAAARVVRARSDASPAESLQSIADGIDRSNPPADDAVPLSPRRLAAINALAQSYRAAASLGICGVGSELQRAARWLESKALVQAPFSDGSEG